jgi:hypothetical protein
MRKYWWLLAMPWMVFHDDTGKYDCSQIPRKCGIGDYECFEEKWVCEDHAEVLNEAHGRRAAPDPKNWNPQEMTKYEWGFILGCKTDAECRAKWLHMIQTETNR